MEQQAMVTAPPPISGAAPLATLTPVFIDFETWVSKSVNLNRMTLRQYMAASYITSVAVGISDDDVEVFTADDELGGLAEFLTTFACHQNYVFVAHNAAFDIRVLRFMLRVPQPQNVWCTLEGAMGAWPELPCGFGLGNLAKHLHFPKTHQKFEIDFETCSPEELARYNRQDVVVMRELYWRERARIPALEQQVALRTHRQRQFHFRVDSKRLAALSAQLDKNAAIAEQKAGEHLTEDERRAIFNRDDGSLKSIRSQRLLTIINERSEVTFETTSLKKIRPDELSADPVAAVILTEASRANKMLSHKRRAENFIGIDEVDVELGYMRAHTGRFSSPSQGKGLNIHSIPKHDLAIAKPVRQMYRLPKELCAVRADLANVEYRIECKLTGCKTGILTFDPAFGGDVFSDPYCSAWRAMTGQKITKKDPVRQVAKQAVLGLGFLMGAAGFAKTLLMALADPKSGITESGLAKLNAELGWDKQTKLDSVCWVKNKARCSIVVATTAFNVHEKFNRSHPDFKMAGDWLVACATAVAGSWLFDTARLALEKLYDSTRAPSRSMIDVSIDADHTARRPSIRVTCGQWVPTLCWREPAMRQVDFGTDADGKRLTILKACAPPKIFSPQLALENVTQAAARNGLCWGVAELERLGFPHVIHIHDEILVLCRRERDEVLRARDALLTVFGPAGRSPWGWATLIRPEEISVTESMFEDEDDLKPPHFDEKEKVWKGGRWQRIEAGVPDCLDGLP